MSVINSGPKRKDYSDHSSHSYSGNIVPPLPPQKRTLILTLFGAVYPALSVEFALLLFFGRSPVKLESVSWSSDAPIANILESNISCHDDLIIVFSRFVKVGQSCFYVGSEDIPKYLYNSHILSSDWYPNVCVSLFQCGSLNSAQAFQTFFEWCCSHHSF